MSGQWLSELLWHLSLLKEQRAWREVHWPPKTCDLCGSHAPVPPYPQVGHRARSVYWFEYLADAQELSEQAVAL